MAIIFTDGSSRGNPGPGGWGAIIAEQGRVLEIGGREASTTNNRMEMKAVIEALKKVSGKEKVTVNIDSSYVVKGIREWIHGWEKNNWVTAGKQPVLNSDLWKELKQATQGLSIFWNIIPGHAGIPGNERCDDIATSYADIALIDLFDGNAADYPISLEIPQTLPEKKKSGSKTGIAYSYVSKIGNTVHVDKSWKDCEARVKGTRGAQYKKVFSQKEEDNLVAAWKGSVV